MLEGLICAGFDGNWGLKLYWFEKCMMKMSYVDFGLDNELKCLKMNFKHSKHYTREVSWHFFMILWLAIVNFWDWFSESLILMRFDIKHS